METTMIRSAEPVSSAGKADAGKASRGPAPPEGSNEAERMSWMLRHIEQLEKEKDAYQNLKAELRELGSKYQSLVENIPDLIYSVDKKGILRTINKSVLDYGYAQDELIGRKFIDFVHPDDRNEVMVFYLDVLSERKSYSRTRPFRVVSKNGDIRWLEANFFIRFNRQGQFVRQEGVCRDITETVRSQHSLLQAQEVLEEQVRNRTHELLQANLDLQKEIEERRATEKALLERETELETEKTNLQEANTALRVLLKRREMDKKDLEEQILYNLKKLVTPYLNKLQKKLTDDDTRAYLSIIESNLDDITSGFSRRLSLEFCGLSPSELKMAVLIRKGKKSREIAKWLNISTRTVESYRHSIRRKLCIDNRRMNLRTFLMSIE
jgi:PAS domain S-box-containing protein